VIPVDTADPSRLYGVDVAFMQLQRHGWDIHAVSAERPWGGPEQASQAAMKLPAARSLAGHHMLANSYPKNYL
jgi:hypothetical protein